jgi:hypothetical protein
LLGDFASWISDPEAYNWLTFVGVVASILTALATGYSAYVEHQNRRDKITSEWKYELYNDHLRVKVSISNNSKSTITGERVVTNGPVQDTILSRSEKNSSWKNNECPAPIEIKTGETKELNFLILPDPKKLRQSSSSWLGWPRSALGKFLWISLRWRLEFGPKFQISITLRKISSPMRPIRLTARKRIYAPQAIKMADTIEEKSAQK